MVIKARHLKNLGLHIARVPAYIRGSRMMKDHIREYGTVPRVVLVGAAGGGLDKWRPWAMLGLVQGLGFEPDPVECGRLRKEFPFAEFHEAALGNRSGSATFYVTSSAQCCSCLEPDARALAPYSASKLFKVERTSKVVLRRFDELCQSGTIRAPHFLQIDVQGLEYEVLEGWGDKLKELVGIELESHFTGLYRGQKALWEIIDFMKSRGFVLRHIEPQGPFGGELVEVNVFFSRLLQPQEKERRSLVKLWEWVCAIPSHSGTRDGIN